MWAAWIHRLGAVVDTRLEGCKDSTRIYCSPVLVVDQWQHSKEEDKGLKGRPQIERFLLLEKTEANTESVETRK